MTTNDGLGRAALAMWVAMESAVRTGPRGRGDRGQATAEYALVVLGAAAVAMLLIAWAISSFSHQVGEAFSPADHLNAAPDPTGCSGGLGSEMP